MKAKSARLRVVTKAACLVASALPLAACSLLLDGENLTGASLTRAQRAPTEGGAPTASAAKPEATTGGGGAAVEAGTTAEAGTIVDAGTTADAGSSSLPIGASPCPGTFAFCDDFDNNTSFVPPWGEVWLKNGQLEHSTEHVRTGGYTARANTVAGPDYDNTASLFRHFEGSAQHCVLGFDVMVTRLDPAGSLSLGVIRIGDDHLRLWAESAGLRVIETESEQHFANKPFGGGGWVRVEVDLDLRARELAIAFDQTTILQHEPIRPSWTAGAPDLALGVVFCGATSVGHEVFLDNVTFDFD